LVRYHVFPSDVVVPVEDAEPENNGTENDGREKARHENDKPNETDDAIVELTRCRRTTSTS